MKNLSKMFWTIALVLIIVLIGVLGFGYYKKKTLNIPNPTVTMEVENFGTIKMELYPEYAPEAVKNFVTLANNGYYNGVKFHRVIKDFMIQSGDAKGDGSGSPTLGDLYKSDDENATYKYTNGTDAKASSEYNIKGEFVANDYKKNTLNLTEGTVAMARADYTQYSPTLAKDSYNSAGSQFFIMTTNDHTNLDGYYAGFGKVIEGMEVVHNIENVECKAKSSAEEGENAEAQQNANTEVSIPVNDVKISSVSVDTHGVEYGKPQTIEPFNLMKWIYAQNGLDYTE